MFEAGSELMISTFGTPLLQVLATATMLMSVGARASPSQQQYLLGLRPSENEGVSMACEERAAQKTKSIIGPTGVSASVIIESHDDYNKDSHDCQSGYIVEVSLEPKLKGLPDGFFSSDGAWERRLSAKVVGFSADGKWLIGFLSEGGEYSFRKVFSYNVITGSHFEANVMPKRDRSRSAKACSPMTAVGVTANGMPVLSADTAGKGGCNKWVADPITGSIRPLSRGEDVSGLYVRSVQ